MPPAAALEPPDAFDDRLVPLARPVAVSFDGHFPTATDVTTTATTASAPPPAFASFCEGVARLLLNTLRLTFFHALNCVLGCVGFVVVVSGLALSIGLLPLCCFGIVVFRLLFFLVDQLAQGDIALQNFAAPSPDRIHIRQRRYSDWFALTGTRPQGLVSSTPTPLTTLYFATVKFFMAVFSAIVLGFTFGFPVTTFSVHAMQSVFFSGFFAVVGFVLLSSFLLVLGTAFMNFSADISCTATRYVCGETSYNGRRAWSIAYSDGEGFPLTVTTYGATADKGDKDDRILI